MTVKNNDIIIGCVADDFTGASDAASFLHNEGLKTLLCNGIPNEDIISSGNFDAVVIALKTRTDSKENAVIDSINALEWFNKKGSKHYYIKYCSTFDSTKEGNIGPIIDAALEKYNVKHAILSPALPINNRIVKNGCLYVDGIPLHESHMKNHPLTPMWHCDIAKLMEPQGKYDCLKIDHEMLKLPSQEIQNLINEFGKDREHFYIIPDYIDEHDAEKIIDIFGEDKILTGGSGILSHLGKRFNLKNGRDTIKLSFAQTSTYGLVLAGSCSKATLGQIDNYNLHKGKSFKIDPIKLLKNEITIEEIWKFIKEADEDVLIYSSDNAEQIKETQKYGKELIANLLESTMSELARRAIDNGIKRIIVAGGETSGAVTKGLGFDAFIIGESIAPGVPIMVPLTNLEVRLVLKSGNFGQADFFNRALELTKR